MDSRYIRMDKLASTKDRPGLLPVARPTIWKWVKEGKFPRPVKLGPRITAWPMADVEKFMAERNGAGATAIEPAAAAR